MNTINDGGPAFPQAEYPNLSQTGMSLRDYFAAKAMAAMLSQRCFPSDAEMPRIAYAIADAMLKAREKG